MRADATTAGRRDGNHRIPRSARDWIVDVFAFVIAVGIGGIAFADAVDQDGLTSIRIVDLVIGALSCLALWARRRWPTQIAVAVVLVSIVSTASGGAVLVLMLTVAVHRPFPTTAAVAAGNILVGVLYFRINPEPELPWMVGVALNTLVIVAVMLWGMFVRARRQLVLTFRERARQAESEAHLRVEQAKHRERERIAREMHDVLAHRLSLLSVHANALTHRPERPTAEIAQASDVIRENAHLALQDLREVIGVLRSPTTPAEPPPDAPYAPTAAEPESSTHTVNELSSLIDESREVGMEVTLDDQRESHADIPAPIARCVYRLVQEGLTNARKYAPGARATVSLWGAPGNRLVVRVHNGPPAAPPPVRDDDRGAASPDEPSRPIPGSGAGLIGLNERVTLSGGTLTYGPTPEHGFTVAAELPWPRP
ncbi:sensor histidine kinase [Actinobacteria bacterium YIM 96077]|uniref:histidine kinase n=1 Tax=Phytoactinopolyspora halophila TaxID=1981511 RepID=A0A329QL81_9ACTN|nr:sensor histidine kinase [Actinobacteria bacterium YIM 96077]RAW12459.1 sensor histidine kinase [Phytoactinopolyspora halophila]